MQNYLEELAAILEKESNDKIKKAMQLFIKCDGHMKSVVLFASGFSGVLSGKNLRDHFDAMDLMDELDSAIDDMEWDIENS